jgi:putative colanic acid biosynthesis acetyltransferase WcaF
MKYQDLVWQKGAQHSGTGGLAVPEGSMHPIRISSVGVPREDQPRDLVKLFRDRPMVIHRDRKVKPMMRQSSPWTVTEQLKRVAWGAVESTVFRMSPHNAYGWRSFLLKIFGANLGKKVRIRRSAHIEIPWNLTIGDHSVVGDWAILYCLGPVKIGRFVTISQYAHLCAGTHETRTRRMELLKPPITIGDDVWVAADAFVGPNVTIGDRTILGARASAFEDLPPDVIAVGIPALPVKKRQFIAEETAEVVTEIIKNV